MYDFPTNYFNFRLCNNTTRGKENEKILLELLDDAFGGWPAVKSYNWDEKDFQWTKAITKARKLGLQYKSLIVVSVFSKEFGDNFILWVSNQTFFKIMKCLSMVNKIVSFS